MTLPVVRKAMKFAAIFEITETSWSAHAPDLPGLGVAGETFEETEQLIREGIEFHIEGLRADGEPVPEPTTRVSEIPVPA
jgi:predicted RNase H-like HicB family nuclease